MHTTPIYEVYKDYPDMKLTDFGGWDLPVNFENGIIAEHIAVRSNVGMFDVSHMGECFVEGAKAKDFLNGLVTNDISKIYPNKAMYTIMCYENGTCVDDLIIYCISDVKFFVVMNASNVEKDLNWLNSHCPSDVKITDLSPKMGQVAIQGPKAYEVLEKLMPGCNQLGFFELKETTYKGQYAVLGRTGYTGEDGFEIYTENATACQLWKDLKELGVQPCGLGARDTLRLESKLPLYGHEISDSITPLEANLSLFVKLDKEADFIGKAALIKQQEQGIPRSLRGFEMVDGGVPRNSYPVFLKGQEIGYVTSGAKSPSCDKFVGYALIKRDLGLKFGDEIEVEIHGKLKKAVLCKTPFYKTTKKTT